jgi:hypothetical protein
MGEIWVSTYIFKYQNLSCRRHFCPWLVSSPTELDELVRTPTEDKLSNNYILIKNTIQNFNQLYEKVDTIIIQTNRFCLEKTFKS